MVKHFVKLTYMVVFNSHACYFFVPNQILENFTLRNKLFIFLCMYCMSNLLIKIKTVTIVFISPGLKPRSISDM